MEQGPTTSRERASKFIKDLVPDWRPSRGQVLWTIRIVLMLIILLGIFTLIGLPFGITLWAWVQLLIVPVVIAGGGLWFNRQQRGRELEIAQRRSQDEALQAYLDEMSQLLTDKERPLHKAQLGDSLSVVSRARTLTVLLRLSGMHKRSVLRFLHEANLIKKGHRVIDLSQADLHEAYLSGDNLQQADLSDAFLMEAVLSRANLREADLRQAFLWRANLGSADLREADLSKASLSEADLSEAVLSQANLREADLSEADLSGAVLSQANLHESRLSQANLSGADLSQAVLCDAPARGANLSEANLSEADLRKADLQDVNLRGADLSRANFHSVYLANADLSKANLREANLTEVFLYETDLRGADLRGAGAIFPELIQGDEYMLRQALRDSSEELEQQASFLEGATMPNGQKYEDWLKSRDREGDG